MSYSYCICVILVVLCYNFRKIARAAVCPYPYPYSRLCSRFIVHKSKYADVMIFELEPQVVSYSIYVCVLRHQDNCMTLLKRKDNVLGFVEPNCI